MKYGTTILARGLFCGILIACCSRQDALAWGLSSQNYGVLWTNIDQGNGHNVASLTNYFKLWHWVGYSPSYGGAGLMTGGRNKSPSMRLDIIPLNINSNAGVTAAGYYGPAQFQWQKNFYYGTTVSGGDVLGPSWLTNVDVTKFQMAATWQFVDDFGATNFTTRTDDSGEPALNIPFPCPGARCGDYYGLEDVYYSYSVIVSNLSLDLSSCGGVWSEYANSNNAYTPFYISLYPQFRYNVQTTGYPARRALHPFPVMSYTTYHLHRQYIWYYQDLSHTGKYVQVYSEAVEADHTDYRYSAIYTTYESGAVESDAFIFNPNLIYNDTATHWYQLGGNNGGATSANGTVSVNPGFKLPKYQYYIQP